VKGRGPKASWLLGAFLAAAVAALFPAWPDDWDGLGFLASIQRFDLASFAPHPPGYPIYVAALKLAALVTFTPIGAARLVGVLSALITYAALVHGLGSPTVAHDDGWVRGAVGAFAVCCVPLVFHALSGVGSEGPALACAAVALAGVARKRWFVVALGVGLGVGVRLSWAPFFGVLLLLLPVRQWLRALGVTLLACLAWGVPLVVVTGWSRLVALGRAHLSGHISHWGGTAVTEPVRWPFFARDLLVDGLGVGTDPFGLALAAALLAVTALALVAWLSDHARPDRLRVVLRGLLLLGPYAAWVIVGQNLRQQPRHVLPLVFALAWALAHVVLTKPLPRFACALLVALGLLLVARTSRDAYARTVTPPGGAQLLAYLREHVPASSGDTAVVYTGASGRFLDGTEWQARTHPAGMLGDALLGLVRLREQPTRMFVTGELAQRAYSPTPLHLVASFCRPERLDRRLPCLDLYELDPKEARRH
jgi:hypothetical protein